MTATPLCNEAGQPIGYFMTVAEHERLKKLEEENRRLLYALANAQFTDEEIARAEEDQQLFTTAEVVRHLESL